MHRADLNRRPVTINAAPTGDPGGFARGLLFALSERQVRRRLLLQTPVSCRRRWACSLTDMLVVVLGQIF